MVHSKSFLLLVILLCWSTHAGAHGGVGMEDDMCVIKIGFLKAHFIGYQQTDDGAEEFCEDAPKVADSIFVIEYLHNFLKQMQVDFRIIKDVNDMGKFANWGDISKLSTLGPDTVYYLPPAKYPNGMLKADFNFQQAGGYIGIVTASHPEKEKTYRAVFYFQVGRVGYGYMPLFFTLLLVALTLYCLLKKRFFSALFHV